MSHSSQPFQHFVPLKPVRPAPAVPAVPALQPGHDHPAADRPVAVPTPPVDTPPEEDICPDVLAAEAELIHRLKTARQCKKPDYSTGEASRILGFSRETVRQMIIRWEPMDTPGRHPAGLFAYRIGTHRRVPHQALLDWFANNTNYLREFLDSTRPPGGQRDSGR